jgi:hypothetical protein
MGHRWRQAEGEGKWWKHHHILPHRCAISKQASDPAKGFVSIAAGESADGGDFPLTMKKCTIPR